MHEDIDRNTYDYPRFGSVAVPATTYEISSCELCGTANVPVKWLDNADSRMPQPICIDSQACKVRCNLADESEDDPMVFYDPTGEKYGIPTYPYRMAPSGLATVRQLRADGLRPGGQTVAAQLLWRRGDRKAFLYRVDLAKPKRSATPAQRAAIDKTVCQVGLLLVNRLSRTARR